MGEIALNIGADPAPRGGDSGTMPPKRLLVPPKRKLCLPKRERCPEEINRLRATELQIEA